MKMLFRIMLVCLNVLLIAISAHAGTAGDVSGDGKIDSNDAALVLQNSIGSIEFTPEQKAQADVSGNGSITAYDAALISQYAMGSINTFPVESGAYNTQATIDVNISVPLDASAPVGSSTIIPINTTDTTGKGIIGVDITLSYNADILTATGVSTDGTIASGWFTYHEITSGRIDIRMYDLTFTGLNGAGILIKVTFDVSASAVIGSESPLALSNVELDEKTPTTTDGMFTAESAGGISITVVGPDGGEKIKGGGVHNITWTSAGGGIDHVHLQYSTNSGGTCQDIITNTPNNGSYEWNPVPSQDSATMRVKAIAEAADNSELAADASNGDFIIDSTPPETSIELGGAEGENGWWTSNVKVTLSSTGDLSDVKWTKRKVNDDVWKVYFWPFYVTGSTVYYYSEDNVGNVEGEKSTQIKIDKTDPETPVVWDDGEYTDYDSQLHASWVSSDAESGVAEFQYAIGTAPNGTSVVDWTSVGADTEVTDIWLNLTDGETYYFSVKAKNGAGAWSDAGFSDGITVNLNMGQKERPILLYPGWNLFSLCLDVENTNILSVLETIEGYYTSVWAYERTSGTTPGVWKRYVPNGDPDLNDLNTIEIGKGYWINMTDLIVLTVKGLSITDTAVQLYQGWNVVGYKSTNILSRQNALSSVASKYTYVSTYDGNWLRHVVDAPGFLSNLNNLEPGYGYCIYAKRNCEWRLSP